MDAEFNMRLTLMWIVRLDQWLDTLPSLTKTHFVFLNWCDSFQNKHVRWIKGILSVSVWPPFCVIQALVALLISSRPVFNCSTTCTEFFAFLRCKVASTRNISSITTSTPLGCIFHPPGYKDEGINQSVNQSIYQC